MSRSARRRSRSPLERAERRCLFGPVPLPRRSRPRRSGRRRTLSARSASASSMYPRIAAAAARAVSGTSAVPGSRRTIASNHCPSDSSSSSGNPSRAQMLVQGQWTRELDGEVVRCRAQQPCGQVLDVGAEWFLEREDRLRREEATDDAPELVVPGGSMSRNPPGPASPAARQVHPSLAREPLHVTRRLLHVGVTRQRPEPASLVAVHGGIREQRPIRGVRVDHAFPSEERSRGRVCGFALLGSLSLECESHPKGGPQPWISQPSVARAASITVSANAGWGWIMRATSG